MPQPPAPTDVELQILRILWERGPSTARQVHNALTEERDTIYSTAVKMLSIMLDKGLVKRDEGARPHVYHAALSREKAQTRALDQMIDDLFGGAAHQLVLRALETKNVSPEELVEIKRLIREAEGGQQ